METEKPLLTYKEYLRVIKQQEKELDDFIAYGRSEFFDFEEFQKLFKVELLNYEDYCDINGYKCEEEKSE